MIKKSLFVKEINLYPPIEDGDLAIEFIIKPQTLLWTHQSSTPPGRLILDLR